MIRVAGHGVRQRPDPPPPAMLPGP